MITQGTQNPPKPADMSQADYDFMMDKKSQGFSFDDAKTALIQAKKGYMQKKAPFTSSLMSIVQPGIDAANQETSRLQTGYDQAQSTPQSKEAYGFLTQKRGFSPSEAVNRLTTGTKYTDQDYSDFLRQKGKTPTQENMQALKTSVEQGGSIEQGLNTISKGGTEIGAAIAGDESKTGGERVAQAINGAGQAVSGGFQLLGAVPGAAIDSVPLISNLGEWTGEQRQGVINEGAKLLQQYGIDPQSETGKAILTWSGNALDGVALLLGEKAGTKLNEMASRPTVHEPLSAEDTSFQQKVDKALPVLKKDVTAMPKKYSSVKTVIDDMTTNAEKLGLVDESGKFKAPNFNETAQLLKKSKSNIYDEYTGKLSGVDAEKFQTDISGTIANKINDLETKLSKENSDVARKSLQQRINELKNLRDTSPTGIQNYIERLNQETRTAKGSPMTIKQIEAANLAGDMRKILDDSVGKLEGEGYQDVRNKYAAYKTIEDQVLTAAKKELNKTPGFAENLTNLGMTAEGINFLLTHNPEALTTGLALKAGNAFLNYLKSPQRAWKSLFEQSYLSRPNPLSPQTMSANATIEPNITIPKDIPPTSEKVNRMTPEQADIELSKIGFRAEKEGWTPELKAEYERLDKLAEPIKLSNDKRSIYEKNRDARLAGEAKSFNTAGEPGTQAVQSGSMKLYHGTTEGGFSKLKVGQGGNQGAGIYLTDNPQIAKYHSLHAEDFRFDKAQGRMPFKAERKIGSTMEVEVSPNAKIKLLDRMPTKTEVDSLKKQGFDGVRFPDQIARDDWSTQLLGEYPKNAKANTTMIFNEDIVKVRAPNSLLQEAKKYKSAEEFVKAVDDRVASNAFNEEKLSPEIDNASRIKINSKSQKDYESQLTDIWKKANQK